MVVSLAQAQMFFLALVRILAMIIEVPMLGGNIIPMQVRVGVGFVLTLVILPWQPLPPEAPTIPILVMAISIAREIFLGLLVGYAATLTFGAVQVAANFMGLNTGFAAGQVLNPTFGSSGAAYDNLYLTMCTMFFMAIDGHLLFIKAIALSFQIVPLNGPFPNLALEPVLHLVMMMIRSGVQLAMPVIGAVVITDVAAGLLSRVAPQIQVFFLFINIKILLSLVAVVLAFAVTIPWLREMFQVMGTRGLMLLGTR
jgi:flagellar biosynthesis protein FliR